MYINLTNSVLVLLCLLSATAQPDEKSYHERWKQVVPHDMIVNAKN